MVELSDQTFYSWPKGTSAWSGALIERTILHINQPVFPPLENHQIADPVSPKHKKADFKVVKAKRSSWKFSAKEIWAARQSQLAALFLLSSLFLSSD